MAIYEIAVRLMDGGSRIREYRAFTRERAVKQALQEWDVSYIVYVRCLTGYDY